MKPFSKILLSFLILSGLQFAWSGCSSGGSASGSVYYGPQYRDPWFHDDPWMDGPYYHRDRSPRYRRGGGGGGGGDIYISPPRLPRPPSPPGIRLP